MAYNNRYNNRNYNGGYNGGSGGYNGNQKPKKKSGAKHKKYTPESGKNKGQNQYITNGWHIVKRALILWKCVTTHKSEPKASGWMGNIACERINRDTGETKLFWGTMERATGKVVIREMGIVINPKARNGGYCGKF